MMGSVAEGWEDIHSNREWGGYPSEHVIRFVARNFYGVPERSKVKILDFGCGQGSNTWYLSREGFDVYAFDIAPSAISKAYRRLSREGLKASFEVCDGINIRYEDSFFDAVIDNVCIYSNNMGSINVMFENVYKILKCGGKFLTVVLGEETDGYSTGDEVEPGTYKSIKTGGLSAYEGEQHIFKRDELIRCLEKIGFKNIVCETSRYTDRGLAVHNYICSCEKN